MRGLGSLEASIFWGVILTQTISIEWDTKGTENTDGRDVSPFVSDLISTMLRAKHSWIFIRYGLCSGRTSDHVPHIPGITASTRYMMRCIKDSGGIVCNNMTRK